MSAEDFGRELPHDLDAERAVLGGMMLSPAAIGDVLEVVTAADYYRPAHAIVHDVIAGMYGRGEPADWLTVKAELERAGETSRTGGPLFTSDLIHSVPAAVNAGWYARIVAEKARLRAVIEAGTAMVQAGWQGDDPGEAAEHARKLLDSVADRQAETGPPSMADLVTSVIGSLESQAERGIPTGISLDLDEVLMGGFAPGQLVLIGARPAIGKSVFAAQAATNAAVKLGMPALLESLEMPAEEITTRILAATCRVPLWSMLRRRLDQQDWDRLNAAYGELAGSPLVIDYAPGTTMARIRARLRSMERTAGCGLLVVDYLQLVRGEGKAENRQAEVAAVARDLKDIAGEHGIPVVACAQLNRGSERRAERRPELSDLRESGELEAAADIVILLHREDAYDRMSPRVGEMDLIVAKNRQGPPCDVTVAFQGEYARIVDMAKPWTAPPGPAGAA